MRSPLIVMSAFIAAGYFALCAWSDSIYAQFAAAATFVQDRLIASVMGIDHTQALAVFLLALGLFLGTLYLDSRNWRLFAEQKARAERQR